MVNTSLTGGVFVDHHVPQAQQYKVLFSKDGNACSCYLMWTDIKENHNKFYVAQALQNSSGSYHLWTRYGRVGLDGVGTCEGFLSEGVAISAYEKKYREKTGKGYTEVKMALGNPKANHIDVKLEEKKNVGAGKADDKLPKSKLDESQQALISFIFDLQLIEQSVVQVGYDAKRLPLGQLDKETVLEGYKYLREIEKVLNGKAKGDLADLSSLFYTYIPHNFSMKHMSNFTIKNLDMVKQKLDLIQNLIDIKIAHKIIKQGRKAKGPKVNPLDEKYAQLNCQLTTLKSTQDEFKMIETYLNHTKEHNKVKILDIFKVDRPEEAKKYNPKKLGNKMLLWHGSRFSNFGGILSQGLRIAPPEAPKTGYLYGKGIYFADMAGKSAPYTCHHLSGGVGLFLLCEVALGKMRELHGTDADADDNLPKTCQSTRGIGTKYPDPKESRVIDKDVTVPLGKSIENDDPMAYRGHNEFIVYNVEQVKMRYLVKVKFN
ncbi:hypothetical protein FGO68_gene2208 [Halteria grandinella]|uniref:Poly [ADP-ribose] polymerase n=1 Tax=Halteria grandinella TaxID=5974 RepID=A0A8J8NQQ5_HALGN|nr:hypothetical protein FGO68_gene2208 [Halteria grandinella]